MARVWAQGVGTAQRACEHRCLSLMGLWHFPLSLMCACVVSGTADFCRSLEASPRSSQCGHLEEGATSPQRTPGGHGVTSLLQGGLGGPADLPEAVSQVTVQLACVLVPPAQAPLAWTTASAVSTRPPSTT